MTNSTQSVGKGHTPGPWYFDGARVRDADGRTVADMRLASGKRNGPTVAAAPDMLEALKAVAEWVGQNTKMHPADAWDMVKAALAKAEGKA